MEVMTSKLVDALLCFLLLDSMNMMNQYQCVRAWLFVSCEWWSAVENRSKVSSSRWEDFAGSHDV